MALKKSRRNVNKKRINWVRKEFGNITRNKHFNSSDKKSILIKLWKKVRTKYPY